MELAQRTPAAQPVPAARQATQAGAARRPVWRDVNVSNVAAGATAVLWYAFGVAPLFLGVMAQLALSPEAVSSWFFITFFTSGVSSLFLALRERMPLAVGWTVPGLVFLGMAGAGSDVAELAGASLVAGGILLLLGLLGLGERLTRWLPLPLVLGMFAGGVLHYATDIFAQLDRQPVVVGAALAGYLGARALDRPWLPPVGGAAAAGIVAAALAGLVHPGALVWGPPQLVPVLPHVAPRDVLALSLPLIVLVVGTGNVQAFGVLASQGYHAPVNLVTGAVGVMSVVNALFGGHPATVQNAGTAILAGEDAGPREQRYVASLVAGAGCLLLAFGATTAGTLLGVLPASLVASLAGLALLRTLMDALGKALAADLRLGAFFALAIAASPLTILGIGPAFWALVGGYAVSFAVERPALLRSLGRR